MKQNHLYMLASTILALFVFTGCSIHKSQGRKDFESQAPNRTLHGLSTENKDTCWTQPATEALWYIDTEAGLSVQNINNDEIQVCINQPKTEE